MRGWRGEVVGFALAFLACGAPTPTPTPAPPPPLPASSATASAAPTTSAAATPAPTASTAPRAEATGLPTGRPPRTAPIAGPPRGELTTLGRHRSQGAVMIGPRVLNLGRDFKTVSGIDATTGQPIWTITLPGQPQGQHVLMRLGKRALLRRQNDLLLLEPSTGQIAAHHKLPMGDRRFLHRVRGACLLNGSCGAQLIDCEDGRPLGPALEGQHVHFHPPPGGGDPGPSCMGFDVQLLGLAGDLVVYSAEGLEPEPRPPGAPKKPLFAGDGRLAAVNRTTGKERWRRDGGCNRCTDASSGIAPDGKTGWVARNDEIEIFDVATGRVRGKLGMASPITYALWVPLGRRGVAVAYGKEVAMVSPFGKLRWQHVVKDDGVLAVVEGTLVTPLSHHQLQSGAKHLAWLDPSNGSERRRVAIGEQVLLPAQDGQAALFAHDLKRDAGGQIIEGAWALSLDVERGRRAGSGSAKQAVLRERRTGATLLTLDHDAWTVGEWSADEGVRHIALFEHDPDPQEPGAVRLLRLVEPDRER